ncbi:DUF1963 domain-containing protein [Streptomyces mirabilis]|uniref:DUF1963 domain-containing protein n=1 Tax=Streptomyces mirabilis TaxID=68239 RepID=UPI003679B46E
MLLAQFGSDSGATVTWGDAGTPYWLIRSVGLAGHCFDQAQVTVQRLPFLRGLWRFVCSSVSPSRYRYNQAHRSPEKCCLPDSDNVFGQIVSRVPRRRLGSWRRRSHPGPDSAQAVPVPRGSGSSAPWRPS